MVKALHRTQPSVTIHLGLCLLATFWLFVPLSAVAGEVRLNGRVFKVPDGFTIELVAGPPLVDRPITADFDEQGRLYVADSSGSTANVQKQLADKPHRIVRLEDTDGDGRFDKQTIFADRMMFPEGTLWHKGSLFVSAPPSIWKLTDTDGDGVADQRAEWFEGKTLTGCANDLHGPYLGPDGWIYWCKGAFAKQTYTLPSGKPFVTRAAHIFRSRPDGTGIEPVMTGGMDNPVEVAFTAGGERIFTTTFLQNPAGGHRDGLIHAIYGGVYGKVHDVIDDHIRTSPDLMPVLSHLGPSASCGLIRYESEVFGPEYRDNLFSTSFNLHKIFRHILKPDGATFIAKDEDFVTSESLDFHPTHLIEDADGSLIVVDTGGWYKLCCPTSQIGKPDILGAIYRVRRTDAKKIDDARGLKLGWGKMSADEMAGFLDDPRLAVRKRAMAGLAAIAPPDQAVRALEKLIQGPGSARGRLNAVWAACRISGTKARAAVRTALRDKDDTIAQAAAHAISVWRDPLALAALSEALAHPSAAVRRAAAEALGRLGNAHAVPQILSAIEKPLDHVLEHSLTYALIEIGSSAELDRQYLSIVSDASKHPAARRAALVALDQTKSPVLASLSAADAGPVIALLRSPDAALRENAAWVISRRPEWGAALAVQYREMLISQTAGDNSDELRRQLSALSKSADIQRLLADLANDGSMDIAVRRTVVQIMSQASLSQLSELWRSTLLTMLADKDWQIADTAAAAFRKMGPKKPTPEGVAALLKLAARTNVPADTRLHALATLPAANSKEGADLPAMSRDLFTFVFARLNEPQTPPQTRLSAAEILGRSRLSHDLLMALAGAGETAGPLELDRILPAFAQENADDAAAGQLLDALDKSKSLAALRVETLRTSTKRFGEGVKKRVEMLAARLAPDADKQKAKLEQLLASQKDGDVRRGQLIFNSTKAACASCHTIGYVGGKVGPDLTRVGAVRAERDLLESIVFPSASFVQSFEPVIVETVDGDTHSGILRKNDSEEVVLVTGPDQEVRIGRKDIKAMRPGALSVMPAGLDQQLTPQELVDLVAFLQGCK